MEIMEVTHYLCALFGAEVLVWIMRQLASTERLEFSRLDTHDFLIV